MEPQPKPSGVVIQFLKDISELSYKHGLGIGQDGVIFVMEADDYERSY